MDLATYLTEEIDKELDNLRYNEKDPADILLGLKEKINEFENELTDQVFERL